MILIPALGEGISNRPSLLVGRMAPSESDVAARGGQFAVGLLLGLAWLPCVGPTLGAAIALASIGQSLGMAFLVLLAAGLASRQALMTLRPTTLGAASRGTTLMGWTLALPDLWVLTGLDRWLEGWAVSWLPDWAIFL